MPIYAYACKSCEKRFEKLVKRMDDRDATPPCPACGSNETTRELTAPAAVTSVGSDPTPMPGCGRCGGPGPCGMG
jgi:putative FmdB family regulatory protein